MAVKDNTTMASNINATPRELDFVTQFAKRFQALMDIMGITDMVEKPAGAKLRYYDAKVTLNGATVSEGDETPYSQAEIVEKYLPEIELEPFSTGVTAKAIKDYGYDIAVAKTDEAFRNALIQKVMSKFYSFILTGSSTAIETTFQMALAMAKGYVDNEFKKLNLVSTGTIGFVNTLDYHAYLGSASISVQNEQGWQYVKDFMGYEVLFLCPGNEIPRGKVVATPKENLIAHYVNPSSSDFARAGLAYVTDGLTNLVGFHTEGKYSHNVSEEYALMGITMAAEYLNGIAVVTVEASGSLGSATITSAAATNKTGATKITLSAPATVKPDWHYFIKAATGTAPSAPAYLGSVDSTWKEISFVNGVCDDLEGLTSGDKAVLVITNGVGQAIAASASAGVSVVVKA